MTESDKFHYTYKLNRKFDDRIFVALNYAFAVLSVLYGGGDIAAAHIATMVLAVSAAGALGGVLGINSAK